MDFGGEQTDLIKLSISLWWLWTRSFARRLKGKEKPTTEKKGEEDGAGSRTAQKGWMRFVRKVGRESGKAPAVGVSEASRHALTAREGKPKDAE